MIQLGEALRLLDERVQPLAPVEVGLAEAIGCRLAAAVSAIIDAPRADVSVMDGYAVRAAECGRGALPVAFEVPAGGQAGELPPGTAARIFTGAELPTGADAVVPQEEATTREASVPHPKGWGTHETLAGKPPVAPARVILPTCEVGSFVRKAGEVCKRGDELAAAGAVVTPQLAGLLAGAGPTQVRAFPRPRTAIVTTGSELVSIQQQPGPGQIRDSNALMLAALARQAHVPARVFERVPDDHGALMNAVRAALERADLVVTSGGVAVGDYDLVPQIVNELGGEIIFRKIAIKPGKPILASRIGAKWFVGLPGNPLSGFVGWHLFIKPMIDRLAGGVHFGSPPEWGVLAEPAKNPGERLELSCATVDCNSGSHRARLLKWKGSHDVVTLANANALAEIPARADLAAGARVRVHHI